MVRLAHFLCELAIRLSGARPADPCGFDLPLTQEQIADALGLTPVHANRTLQSLRGNGLVIARGGTLTIPSFDALAAAGEFDPAYLHLALDA